MFFFSCWSQHCFMIFVWGLYSLLLSLNNFLMPKRTLYMPSYTYPIEGLSSQSTIHNKLISGDIRFTTIKQSFQNLLSKMMETATLLLLSLKYLASTKNLLVTKACKSCLWSWRILSAMNVATKQVAPSRRISVHMSFFSTNLPQQHDYTQKLSHLMHVLQVQQHGPSYQYP